MKRWCGAGLVLLLVAACSTAPPQAAATPGGAPSPLTTSETSSLAPSPLLVLPSPIGAATPSPQEELIASRVLPPQSGLPVRGLCSLPVRIVSGAAYPTFCPDGRINVIAWSDFAAAGPEVMKLGPSAGLASVLSAIEVDASHKLDWTFDTPACDLTAAYSGWALSMTCLRLALPMPTGTPVSSSVLTPARVPPVILLCSSPLVVYQDGNIDPLFCPGPAVNVLAWQHYAPDAGHILGAGPGASVAAMRAAFTADTLRLPLPEQEAFYLAAAYYGWSVMPDPSCSLWVPPIC